MHWGKLKGNCITVSVWGGTCLKLFNGADKMNSESKDLSKEHSSKKLQNGEKTSETEWKDGIPIQHGESLSRTSSQLMDKTEGWKDGIPVLPSRMKSGRKLKGSPVKDLEVGEKALSDNSKSKEKNPASATSQKLYLESPSTASEDLSIGEQSSENVSEWKDGIPAFPSSTSQDDTLSTESVEESNVEEKPSSLVEQKKISAPPVPSDEHDKFQSIKSKEIPAEEPRTAEQKKKILKHPLHREPAEGSPTSDSSIRSSSVESGVLADEEQSSENFSGWKDGIPVFPSVEKSFKEQPDKKKTVQIENKKDIPDKKKTVQIENKKDIPSRKEYEDSAALVVTGGISGKVLKEMIFEEEDDEEDRLSTLHTLVGSSMPIAIKDQRNYAVYLVIIGLNTESNEGTNEEPVDLTENVKNLPTMNVQVLKWSKDHKPEIIQISPKPKPSSVPLCRVVERETIIKGRRQMKVSVARLKSIDEASQAVTDEQDEEEEKKPTTQVKTFGGIKDVSEDYLASLKALKGTSDVEDEDLLHSFHSSQSLEHTADAEEDSSDGMEASEFGDFDQMQGAGVETSEMVKPSDDTSHQPQEDRKQVSEIVKPSPDTFHQVQDDETREIVKPSNIETPQLQLTTVSRVKDAAPDVEDRGVAASRKETVAETTKAEKTKQIGSDDDYLDCEICPCGGCSCSRKCCADKKQPGQAAMQTGCALKQAGVQTGTIYLSADNEEKLDGESNIFQVLSNAAIILDVHASIVNIKKDTPGKMAIISIRPLMMGKLTQNKTPGSEDHMGEALLEPVNTKAVHFQVLLDTNGRLQEPISEIAKRLQSELLRQDEGSKEIIQQWYANVPDIHETSESLVQGLLSMLPEILVAKGFCSIDDMETDESVHSDGQDSMDKDARFPTPSSSIVLIVSPALSAEDTTYQGIDRATNTETEEHGKETGRVEQNVSDEAKSGTREDIKSLKDMATHEEKHHIVSSIVEHHIVAKALDRHLKSSSTDAADETDDQSKGTGDTHETETTSERDTGRYVDEEGDEYYDALDFVYTSSDKV